MKEQSDYFNPSSITRCHAHTLHCRTGHCLLCMLACRALHHWQRKPGGHCSGMCCLDQLLGSRAAQRSTTTDGVKCGSDHEFARLLLGTHPKQGRAQPGLQHYQ